MDPNEISAIPKNLTQVNKLAASSNSLRVCGSNVTPLPGNVTSFKFRSPPVSPFLPDSALVGLSHSHGHRSLATDMLLDI